MTVAIREHPDVPLARYQDVPISFLVREEFAPVRPPPGHFGCLFTLRPVAPPWVKEYDHPGNRPEDWPRTWDISRWGLFTAWEGATLVGGAAVAWNTPGVHMLEGRIDLAVLWDLRVAVDSRGRGIGRGLFQAAVAWCRERRVAGLKIETQTINVPACRFYAAQGCTLEAVNRRAYPDLPDETQVIWFLPLADRPPVPSPAR